MAAPSSTHRYKSNSEIHFFFDDQDGLSVTIDTERLHIRSVESNETEYDNYTNLFGDMAVMEKFMTGQTKTREEIQQRIDAVWVKRWKECDPYTGGLAVFQKDTDVFLGHVVLSLSDQAGKAELAYLFNQSAWGKGYGTEAVTAIVKEYAPAAIQEGYTLGGKPLEIIVATARSDNPSSSRILEKIGLHFMHSEQKYGALRHYYSINVSEYYNPNSLVPIN